MRFYLRYIQTFFPFLQDLRFKLKYSKIKYAHIQSEADFNALKMFEPSANQVFVDIGANRGETILSMLIHERLKNKIIGFEPNPVTFEKIKNNSFIRSERVSVHNVGLSSSNQDLTIYVPVYRKWIFDGLASFNLNSAKNWLSTRLWRYSPKHFSLLKLKCKVRKLDDYKLNPYFIKIDVQDHELEVLKGSARTLETHQPVLLIESIKPDIIKFLEQFDYSFYSFKKGKFLNEISELNTFCIVREKHQELIRA